MMGLFQNPAGLPILGVDRNYSFEQIPSLTGKVAIVTGGSRGIGYETSLALARAGAKVYIAAQSQSNAEAAITKIKDALGGTGDLEFLELKLQNIASAITAGRNILSRESRLDIIIANAGVHAQNQLNDDGIELVMAVNHVGHQAFIMTLLPLMLSTSKTHDVATHIAVTSSHSHFDIQTPRDFAVKDFTSLKTHHSEKFLDFNIRYARSKLANVLFALHLSELLQTPEYRAQGGDRVFVNAAHPGVIKTDMADSITDLSNRWVGIFVKNFAYYMGISAPDGALTQLFLATSPKIEENGIRGKYFVPIAKEVPPSKMVTSERAKELWEWTDAQIQKAAPAS